MLPLLAAYFALLRSEQNLDYPVSATPKPCSGEYKIFPWGGGSERFHGQLSCRNLPYNFPSLEIHNAL